MEETAKKALVLDDEEVILNTCREILEETGLEIITSTSPAECIDIASAGGIDLFITDIMMPELNGVEVVRRIRKTNPRLTVIVITGYPSMDTAREFMKLGAYDYIPKPFTPEELRNAVSQAIGAKDPKKSMRETLVLEILDRTSDDPDFFDRLYMEGSEALKDYDISSEAKTAIATGDVKWIEENVGKLTDKQMMTMARRLESEIW
ncbi:MAG TPA: response regulator [bacterium]|nr:MAG: Alginate biosynthesis transcriptional regulatory protein AlgB [bacterium ADurb.Bin236]HOC90756.1 response regulator [bacterium]HOY63319.1 response regulator [bacterium]HPN95191.1 response regulator [bacterium]